MKILIEESVLRQALETFTHCYAETDRRINERAKILVELRSTLEAAEKVEMLDAERAECEEQARLNGMGAEREAALLAKVDGLERELTATQHVVAQYAEGERKLRAELVKTRLEASLDYNTLFGELQVALDELSAANKLAADRLEQMNEDRKAYLELRDRLTDAENLLRIVASTMCATPDLQTSAKNYFRKRGIKK